MSAFGKAKTFYQKTKAVFKTLRMLRLLALKLQMKETDVHCLGKNFFITIKQIVKLIVKSLRFVIIIYIRQNLAHLSNSNLARLKEYLKQ